MRNGGSQQNTSIPIPRLTASASGISTTTGSREAVVGWGSPANQTGNVSIYAWHEGNLCDIRLDRTYSEMAVSDLDGDGGDELFLVEVAKTEAVDENTTKETPAGASIYRVSGDTAWESSPRYRWTALSFDMPRSRSDKLGEGQTAVVMDGVKADNSMVSELVYWQGDPDTGYLVVQPELEDANAVNISQRNAAAAITSRDINRDGYLEIPTVELMPGIEGDEGNISNYIIHWNRLDMEESALLRVVSTVVSQEYNYFSRCRSVGRIR